ncbi:MAG TPA: type I 3-dehydroquinate dehydratase, partial [Pirellulales bacterium]|nr:type I 3-dehydroquinate dehydratase [Pirellulales bacterium]
RLLNDRPGPVIVTIRRPQDGGKYNGSEQERLVLLRTAIADGVDYVDLEEDVAAAIPRYGKTRRIVSLHDFRKTPDDVEAIHAQLAGHDADIVKMATMANQPHDNLRILNLIRNSKVPTVAMCMGDIGTPSRLLAGRFGAPFTYATFHHERTLAPGQLSFQQMNSIYHYDQIQPSTAVYGVIGDPIGHSLSPLVHNAALRQLKIDGVYIPFRVPREHLQQFIDDAPALGIRALSVTIPHKELVLKNLAQADETTRGVGAANTLVFGASGIAGYNTDQQAAMDSLEHALRAAAAAAPGTTPADVAAPSGKLDLSGQRALVLGAGGAAKAIGYGLKLRGADVVIAGRTPQRAQQLAARLQCRVIDWNARYSVEPDLLVNCTPVGMHPNVDATPYEKHHLKPSMTVFDTVYNPENTLLIKDARSQSCTVINGVEMFVRQASLQFALFTGVDAPCDRMREMLKRAIGAAKL